METAELTPPVTGPLAGYLNHSGGAEGADTSWDVLGRLYGVSSIHWREPGQTRVDSPLLRQFGVQAVPMSAADYEEGMRRAKAAAAFMGRKISATYAHYPYRNWAQVLNAEAVFAVSRITLKGAKMYRSTQRSSAPVKQTQVDGGTGYAVQMAIDAGKPVYVFCMYRSKWFQYVDETLGSDNYAGDFRGFRRMSQPPVLTRTFAGIGSRQLSDAGLQAIKDVYDHTVNQLLHTR